MTAYVTAWGVSCIMATCMNSPSAAEVLAEPPNGSRPGVARGREVGAVAFALLAQESVAGAVIHVWIVRLAGPLQRVGRRRDGGGHPCIVAAVEADQWGGDGGQVGGVLDRPVVHG